MAFTSLIAPVIFFAIVMILFGDLIIQILQLIPELLEMVKLLFDPEKFIKELIYGVFVGIIMIFTHIFDYIEGITKKIVDKSGISDNMFGMSINTSKTVKINGNICKFMYSKNGNNEKCSDLREKITDTKKKNIKDSIVSKVNEYISNIKKNTNIEYYLDKSDDWWTSNLNVTKKEEQDISKLYNKIFTTNYYKDLIIKDSSVEIIVSSKQIALVFQQMIKDIKYFNFTIDSEMYSINAYQVPNEMVCAKTTLFRYVILVLCPPLYVGIYKGFKGWHYVIIDIILTLLFYFPGVLYAYIICVQCNLH